MVTDPIRLGSYIWNRARIYYGPYRPVRHACLRAGIEIAPSPENRVTLSRERDALGMPRAELAFRLSAADWESYRKNLAIVSRTLDGRGLQLTAMPPSVCRALQSNYGYHHMGTTRMQDDTNQGVVDRNCRVHGIDNLYVAGSSVFTTGGYSNPTLTILALAVRLAGHLRDQ
jgi:choline dehydrogenase-like flavoprotein